MLPKIAARSALQNLRQFLRVALRLLSAIATMGVLSSHALAKTEAPNPAIPGPLPFQTAEYKFPAKLDADVLATASTELWARVFWPTDLSKPRPIVFLLHGNHSTCRENNQDFDCSYTNEGTCPAGATVVLNHEGYNYLGQELASLGFIAVTINANRGITCGNSNNADWGLNLARGRLVLRHIEQWNLWATQGGAPASLGLPSNAFIGKVDLKNVGLVGHSRGGEGMRAAAALYRDQGSIWPARIPNLQIRGIFEIGSVDGQTGRVLDADDMAWNQLLPMCDGDVSDLEGRNPFERMLLKTTETHKTPKSLTMVWGTNHNFYNTQWQEDESTNCLNHQEVHGPGPTSENQQKIAATEVSAFMLANVGANRDAKMGELFDPTYDLPSSLSKITRIDRDGVFTYDRVYDAVVDDFDQATGMSSNHVANVANGVTVTNNVAEKPSRAEIAWTAAGTDHFVQLNWADTKKGRDVSAYTSLDLRVGRPLDQIHEPSTEFSIALVDATDHVSASVPVTKYADIMGPGNEVDLYQTVRIPLGDFGLAKSAQIRGVRVIFDKSAKGSLHFANVRFAGNNPVAFAAASKLALKPKPVSASVEVGSTTTPAQTPVPPSLQSTTPPPPSASSSSPFAQAPKLLLQSARFTGSDVVDASKYLDGGEGVEISVAAQHGVFPAEAQLPTLVMAGAKFSVSRYAPTGRLDKLIFSIPREDFENLPEQGSAWVQYGRTGARKVWTLPNFVKSEIAD